METLREILVKLLFPLGRVLAALKIPPNAISISGIVFGVASGYLFSVHLIGWAVAFFIMNALADGVDGVVARLREKASPFGAFFDNFCGGYGDVAVFYGLIVGGFCHPAWGVAALAGTLMRMVTFRLPAIMTDVVGDPPLTRFPYALAGKGDRVIIVSIAAVLGYLGEGIILVAILTNAVAVLRTAHFHSLKELARPNS